MLNSPCKTPAPHASNMEKSSHIDSATVARPTRLAVNNCILAAFSTPLTQSSGSMQIHILHGQHFEPGGWSKAKSTLRPTISLLQAPILHQRLNIFTGCAANFDRWGACSHCFDATPDFFGLYCFFATIWYTKVSFFGIVTMDTAENQVRHSAQT